MKLKLFFLLSIFIILISQILTNNPKKQDFSKRELKQIEKISKELGINSESKMTKDELFKVVNHILQIRMPSFKNKETDFFKSIINKVIERIPKDEFILKEIAPFLSSQHYARAIEDTVKERFGEEGLNKYKRVYKELEEKRLNKMNGNDKIEEKIKSDL